MSKISHTIFTILVATVVAAGLFIVLFLSTASSQVLQSRTIQIYDEILKPAGNHLVSRQYKVWDQSINCFGVDPALILAFHGGGGNPISFSQSFKPQPHDCYVTVYPAGSEWTGAGWAAKGGSWNSSGILPTPGAGPACSPGQGRTECQGVSDDTFAFAVLNAAYSEFGPFRAIYGLGHSKGGMMVHGLACRGTIVFNAIATVAATVNTIYCEPTYYPELMHVHGMADVNVCWSDWYPSCDPFPLAETPISIWQNSSVGADPLVLLDNCPHTWPTITNCGYNTRLQIRNWFRVSP